MQINIHLMKIEGYNGRNVTITTKMWTIVIPEIQTENFRPWYFTPKCNRDHGMIRGPTGDETRLQQRGSNWIFAHIWSVDCRYSLMFSSEWSMYYLLINRSCSFTLHLSFLRQIGRQARFIPFLIQMTWDLELVDLFISHIMIMMTITSRNSW